MRRLGCDCVVGVLRSKNKAKVRVLGKTGDDACAKAGYFRDGWILNKSGLKFQKKRQTLTYLLLEKNQIFFLIHLHSSTCFGRDRRILTKSDFINPVVFVAWFIVYVTIERLHDAPPVVRMTVYEFIKVIETRDTEYPTL